VEVESAGLSLRIRDELGAWVVDYLRPGGRASVSGEKPFSVRIAPGRYTAEIHADHFRTGSADFIAVPDIVVPIELLPGER
jgi:hypothetical protein